MGSGCSTWLWSCAVAPRWCCSRSPCWRCAYEGSDSVAERWLSSAHPCAILLGGGTASWSHEGSHEVQVREPIDVLEQYDEDAEIRVAFQPSWPLRGKVAN